MQDIGPHTNIIGLPITGIFGAIVEGMDLAKPLGKSELNRLRNLLDQYKVLVFRDQHTVGPRELDAFSRYFGAPELERHPTFPHVAGLPAVKVVEANVSQLRNFRDTWHTDGSTREDPRCLTVLQAIDVPRHGRDTLFADMEAAYDELSDPMKAFLESLTALHSWEEYNPGVSPVKHSVIRRHPRTGRKSIYVNRHFTRQIVGLTDRESAAILEYLFSLAHIPEFQLRVTWRPGTIVLWDNERTLHYIVRDYEYPRVMHRCMIF
jgi:taurine dioxygenase